MRAAPHSWKHPKIDSTQVGSEVVVDSEKEVVVEMVVGAEEVVLRIKQMHSKKR